jgi:NTP pyrophosphatase (non-canonical NTP hydrolase)
MVTLKEYRVFTCSTNIVPPHNRVTYDTAGLVNEIAEFLDVVDGIEKESFDRTKLVAELGDIMWYLTQLMYQYGIEIEKVFGEDLEDIVVKSIVDEKFKVDKTELRRNIRAHTLEMIRSIGKAYGYIKKYLRGDTGFKSDQFLNEMCAVIAWYKILLALCGTNIQEVLTNNVEKLSSRHERGVLKGDGDQR